MKKNLRTPKFVAYIGKATKENLLRRCITCDKELVRKRRRTGYYEAWERFIVRKTCGRLANGKFSECQRIAMLGDKNPKWRGGLPICKKCGERTAWYKGKEDNPQNYCKPCFNLILAEINRERMHKLKGIYPKSLIPFAFKKGRVAQNKLYDMCQIPFCGRPHLAKALCNKHYQARLHKHT